MPIAVKQVKGHEYLYFSYYDRDTGKKKEVYMGPKNSLKAVQKALHYSKEFFDLQQCQINSKYRRIDKYVKMLTQNIIHDDVTETS